MQLTTKQQEYWRKNLRITGILLFIWFVATFVMGFYARPLNEINFFGWPLAFYMRADGVEERVGRGLFDEQRRRADAHRKQQEPAEAESKRKRRTAAKDVVGACTQHVRRKALAHREHVPVEVHRRLGHPRRSRGERKDAGVVDGGVHVAERVRLPRHAPGTSRARSPRRRR